MSFSGHPPLGNKSPNKADDDGRTETRDVLKKNADAAAHRRNERTTRNILVWITGKQWKVGPKGGYGLQWKVRWSRTTSRFLNYQFKTWEYS